MKTAQKIIRLTFAEWNQDQAPHLAAALAYYSIFSIGPILVVAITLAGLIFGRSAVEEQVHAQISALIGTEGADFIRGIIIDSASQQRSGLLGPIIGVITLLLGTLGVFGELQNTLNAIWNVRLKSRQGILAIARQLVLQRVLSFGMVVGLGSLLVVSLLLAAAVSALSTSFGESQNGPGSLLWWGNNVILFILSVVVFALLYKVLPDAHTGWREVFLGGLVTALLFSLGRILIGLYLVQIRAGAGFGAAGALVVLLLWIYFSAQIVFLGAEFTQVYASVAGSGIRPRHHAELIRENELAAQGKEPKEIKVAQPGPVHRGEERLRKGVHYWHDKARKNKMDYR